MSGMDKVKKVKQKIKDGFLKEVFFELKWIFSNFSVYKGYIFGYAALNLAVTLIALLFTIKSADLIDMLVNRDWHGVLVLGGLYVVIGALNISFSILRQRMSSIVWTRVNRELSNLTYAKIMDAKWEKIAELHTGDLITRLNNDVSTIAGCVVGWIPDILVSGVQIVAALGCIVYYDVSMLLVVAAVAPIVLLGSRIFIGKVYEKNKEQRKLVSELTTFEKESFQNIHAIKAFGLSEEFAGRMTDIQYRKQNTDLDANKYSILSWTVMYISGQIAALICLLWAVYHVYTGVITLGVMTMMALLAGKVSAALKSLMNVIPGSMSTIASAARVRTLLEIESEECENEEEGKALLKEAGQYGADITVKDISFSYANGRKIFDNVSFHADSGEIIALVGPSGEGKTTMLRILLGIVSPQEGEALIGIHKEQGINMPIGTATRRALAYVPQGNTMLSGTIADNMRIMKKNATDDEIIDALKQACAYEFVEKLPDGINHLIGEGGTGFSEGQNQRLSIARALLCNAPVLLLDEATSALDVVTERKVLNNLMGEGKSRTCILTTHRPSVLSMCNRVYRIASTNVSEIGEEDIRQLMNDF